jgi:predicted nucleotidyltransferase
MMDSNFRKLKACLSEDENICFALIFGSHATNRAAHDSDLDLAACFYDPPEGLELLNMINHLSNVAQKEVDLVVLNRASAFLRHQIFKEGVRLLIKDPIKYRKFREKTMMDYDTYRYLTQVVEHD